MWTNLVFIVQSWFDINVFTICVVEWSNTSEEWGGTAEAAPPGPQRLPCYRHAEESSFLRYLLKVMSRHMASTVSLFCQDPSIHHLIHLMYSFYSLTSLRVNVSFSVSSCRRRWNLQGSFHRTHRLPGGGHPTWPIATCLCLQPRGHHQRNERPCCRGRGHVSFGRHGVRPAGRGCHGDAVTVSPKMMCWCRYSE